MAYGVAGDGPLWCDLIVILPVFVFTQAFWLWRKEAPLLGLPWRLLSLVVALLAAAALASLHWHEPSADITNGAGGVMGLEIGRGMAQAFGLVGGTLLLLTVLLVGVTLATSLSWFWLMDTVGHFFWDVGAVTGALVTGRRRGPGADEAALQPSPVPSTSRGRRVCGSRLVRSCWSSMAHPLRAASTAARDEVSRDRPTTEAHLRQGDGPRSRGWWT